MTFHERHTAMDTLHEPSDISADPQAATPYFRLRQLRFDRAVRAEAARRGLPPDPLAA